MHTLSILNTGFPLLMLAQLSQIHLYTPSLYVPTEQTIKLYSGFE